MSFNTSTQLRKYWIITKASWINGLAYPVSFWMWRFRQFLQSYISLSLWTSIYVTNVAVLAYDRGQMLSYIFTASMTSVVIFCSRSIDVAGVIYRGDLSTFLIKPIRFFWYWFCRDLADKLYNLLFAIAELSILYMIFRPPLALPNSLEQWFFVTLSFVGGLLLYFFVNLIFGCIGFWSPDVWSPRFLFFVVSSITSGTLFPLDLLPRSFMQFFLLTPFPYLAFFQTQLVIGKIHGIEAIQGLGMLFLWIAIAYTALNFLWKKGIRDYEAVGR